MQRNDSSAYLPAGAEATRALAASKRFTSTETTTAVVVYSRSDAGRLTEDDRIQILFTLFGISEALDNRLASPAIGPVMSGDQHAAQVILNLSGSDPVRLREDVTWLRTGASRPPGLTVNVSGPAAAVADLTEVFSAVDGVLVLVAASAVLLILVLVYRSPILPLLVLGVAGLALGTANGLVYLLARAGAVTVSGDAQGILSVLVLGAATDYALLLVARFREELRRHADRFDAMRVAWRSTAPAILASGATVILALLCLLAADLATLRGLGPVTAVGVACALATMLVALPAALVLLGRRVFWPFTPAPGSAADRPAGWARFAAAIGRRPRLVWTVTVLVLATCALGLARLDANGVPRTESFLAPVDSNAGQEVLDRHFPEASGTPVVVIARAERIDALLAAVAGVSGVRQVRAFVDPVEAYDARLAGLAPPAPKVVDGLVRVEVTLAVPGDSVRARSIVTEVRRTVRLVPGSGALVGGYTAANLDIQRAARADRLVVIPLVLAVVLLVLGLLLRAAVAALVLVATVVLSYLATLGVCGVVFTDVAGFAGADASFPLFVFVFLVALGVDYNIFLMTRVREEVARHGHRDGTLAGLAVTGGVITSAGLVLAATFAGLAILPLVFLAQLAFAIVFGVLLDALVVRSVLVPALTVDIGRWMWWPTAAWTRRSPE